MYAKGGVCMDKNIIDFKVKLEEDEDFRNKFTFASNLDELVDLAKENGYDLDIEKIEEDHELSDYLLEEVAGGEDNTYINEVKGDYNIVFTAANKEEAERYAKMMVEELHKRGIYGKS